MDTSSLASGVQHGLWLAVKVTHGENTAGSRDFGGRTSGGFLGGGLGLHVRHHD
jgi:hypothetical protein